MTDPDHAPGALNVQLTYSFGTLYSGSGRMTYNADTKVFTFKLPPFEEKHNPDREPGFITLGTIVMDPTGDGPPPRYGAFVTINDCFPISNG